MQGSSAVLEAKPLRQGQKTRILGRQSQSYSQLWSRYRGTPLVEELQFLDYRAYHAKANSREPGHFS